VPVSDLLLFLVFANKQDLPGALSMEEIREVNRYQCSGFALVSIHKRVLFENLRPCHLGRVADPVFYWTCPDPVSEKLPEFGILDLGHISASLIL
jgi:hypothetical protein